MQAALYLLPAILLLFALRARRYPGEHALLAVIVRRGSRRRVAIAPRSYRARPRVALARGGDLLGRELAVRPPPQLLVVRI